MRKFVIGITGMQAEDYDPFRLLFLHAFCMGIFLAFFNAISVSLFVTDYGNEFLPYAYLLGGGLGLLSSNVFSFIQKRFDSRFLYLANVFFLGAIMALFLVISHMREEIPVLGEHLSFAMFVCWSAFLGLMGLQASGLATRLFTLRQGKRLLSLVNAGEVTAAIIGNFSIATLLEFVPSAYSLLYISAGGLVLVGLVLVAIFTRFPKSFEKEKSSGKEESATNVNFIRLLRNPYVLLLSLVALIGAMSIYFADFGFLGGIREMSFEKTEAERQAYIVSFFGLFFGFSNLAELGMSLLSGKLVKQFGMGIGLTLQPAAMFLTITFAVLAAVIIPDLPIVFFLFLALTRLFDEVFRRTLAEPSIKVILLSFSGEIKPKVQVLVEGIIKQSGTVIAALFLLAANYFLRSGERINLTAFCIALLPLLGLWGVAGIRLFRQYKDKLQEVLLESRVEGAPDIARTTEEALKIGLKEEEKETRRAALRLAGELAPQVIEEEAPRLLRDWDLDVRKMTMGQLNLPYGREELINPLRKVATAPRDEVEAALVHDLLDKAGAPRPKAGELESLLDSTKRKDWEKLLHILNAHPLPRYDYILQRLLQSRNSFLRISGILLAPGWNTGNTHSSLIRNLLEPRFAYPASLALGRCGNQVLPQLEAILRTDYEHVLHLLILEIARNIGTPEACAFLFRRLTYPNREIQITAIAHLFHLRFRVEGNNLLAVKHQIEFFAKQVTWLLACIADLVILTDEVGELVKALRAEVYDLRDTLLNLMGFIHNPDAIEVIRENLAENRTAAENSFAIELLDNLLEEDVKEWTLPLLDNVPEIQRVRAMHALFPLHEMEPVRRLREIVNRDYSMTSLWVKALALEVLGAQSDPVGEEMIAQLFHPHPLLHEIAFEVILKHRPEKLEKMLVRLPAAVSEKFRLRLRNGKQGWPLNRVLRTLKGELGEVSPGLLRIATRLELRKGETGDEMKFNPYLPQTAFPLEGEFRVTRSGTSESYFLNEGAWYLQNCNLPAGAAILEALSDGIVLTADKAELLRLAALEPGWVTYLIGRMPGIQYQKYSQSVVKYTGK